MSQSLLVINDFPTMGKVALAASYPLLVAMGIDVLPLASLNMSSHTGGFDPVYHLSSHEYFQNCLQAISQQFGQVDGVFTGYFSQASQADQVLSYLDQHPNSKLYVDPIMADSGKYYSGKGPEDKEAMKKLLSRAEICFPNLTEACLLTESPYQSEDYWTESRLSSLAEKIHQIGCKQVLITGIPLSDWSIGIYVSQTGSNKGVLLETPLLEGSYFGTGDLFAAICLGAYLSGKNLVEASSKAMDFVDLAIQATIEEARDPKLGLAFHKVIKHL